MLSEKMPDLVENIGHDYLGIYRTVMDDIMLGVEICLTAWHNCWVTSSRLLLAYDTCVIFPVWHFVL